MTDDDRCSMPWTIPLLAFVLLITALLITAIL